MVTTCNALNQISNILTNKKSKISELCLLTATEGCHILWCEGDKYSAKQCDGDECYCADPETGTINFFLKQSF